MNRREFVIGSTAALLMAVAGGSYALSTCPLDTEGTGICTGPCSAFIDFDGDGFCDRVPPPPQVAQAVKPDTAGGSVTVIRRACPFGLLNDPYPGECNLYVDADNDGICDLSQSGTTTADGGETVTSDPDGAGELVQEVDQASSSASVIQTACPLGLVNDPYPGECRRYVDDNQNGICDLSEPALIASGEIAPLPTPTQAPEQAAGLAPIPRPQTACPYGLVNDPYPGECRKYVDNNNNGICDLSEPELVASGAVLPPSTDTTEHSADGQGGGQQRQRGKNN